MPLSLKAACGLALLIAATVFAAVAPTLRWTQLTGGNENIVIQTALEIRRGECGWLLPTMLGEPRVKKPPLVAWIVAASLREETIRDLSDPARREAAYVDLAWQVRWSALLAGCLTILATFALARVIVGNRDAVIAAAVCGTLILFQRYMRQSTTDVHLALWVAVANAALAYGLLRGRWAIATPIAALALGIAFLCKGPVALVQTLAPALCFLAINRFSQSTTSNAPKAHAPQGMGLDALSNDVAQARSQTLTLPSPGVPGEGFVPSASTKQPLRFKRAAILLLIAFAIFAIIAAPWFLYVAANVPGVLKTWFVEVNREGATDLDVSNPLVYLLWIPLSWPWIVFLFVSGFVVIQQFRRRPALLLPVLQVWVPLLIMVIFRDRKERYLLPLVAPVAILCAIGIAAFVRAQRDRPAWRRVVAITHWASLAILCIAFPIAGATLEQLRGVDGRPWFSPPLALTAACGLALLITTGILAQRRYAYAFVATAFIAMLILQALLQHGYAQGTSGRSQLKRVADAILRDVPDAEIYDYTDGKRLDEETAIYLNRIIPLRDPFTLPPSDRPQVWITRQNRDAIRDNRDPIPPPGFRPLITVPERANRWWAFVRPPAAPPGAATAPTTSRSAR